MQKHRVVRGGRAGTPSSPYFCTCEKGSHEIQSQIFGWKTDIGRGSNALAVYGTFFGFVLGIIAIHL